MSRKYETSVNKFTRDVLATLQVNNIQNFEFYNDVNSLKSQQISENDFKSKYTQLFDGTFSKFKSTDSFLGSYRRNTNPNYYTQSKDVKVQNWNKELRDNTVKVKKIRGGGHPRKPKKPKRRKILRKDKFFDKVVYNEFARDKVARLRQVWQIKHVIDNNLFGYQNVNIVINVDVCSIVKGKIKVITPNLWITFTSGISMNVELVRLYDYAYNEFLVWLSKLEQSKLIANIKDVYTEVYRRGD